MSTEPPPPPATHVLRLLDIEHWREPPRQPTWDELVEEHRRECEQTDEQIAAGWARLVAERPEAEKLILHSGPVQRSPAFNKKLARFRARQKRRAARERAFGCSEISVRLWVPLWIVRILVALRIAGPATVKVEPLRVVE